MSDSLIAIAGRGWVVIASDAMAAHSIIAAKGDEDKIYPLDDDKLLGCCGDPADRTLFCEFVQKNVALYTLMNSGLRMTPHSAANWVRTQIRKALREGPYQVNLVVAGTTGELFHIDYLGALQRLNYTAQGYAGHFVLGLLDRYWRPDMTLDEGLELLTMCVREVQARLVLNAPRYIVKAVVAGRGICVMNPIEGAQPLPPYRPPVGAAVRS